jgi:AcrR family transcriptional regulator
MSKRRGPNKENLEETRLIFIEAAKKEFTEHGYTNASTNRIVEQSGMARGSLYYHFGDKNGLFRAVYEATLNDSLRLVSAHMDQQKSAWDALLIGSEIFIDLCAEKDFRKIVLIESQSALTYADRITIQQRTLLGKLQGLLPELIENGFFPGHTPMTIAVFIMGILAEIGRSFDLTDNPEQVKNLFKKAYVDTLKRFS